MKSIAERPRCDASTRWRVVPARIVERSRSWIAAKSTIRPTIMPISSSGRVNPSSAAIVARRRAHGHAPVVTPVVGSVIVSSDVPAGARSWITALVTRRLLAPCLSSAQTW